MRVIRVAALLAAVALAGCGGRESNDVAAVKKTLTRTLSALADGDGATVCSLATPSGQAELRSAVPGATCEHVVRLVATKLTPELKDGLRSAHINMVTVHERTATVDDRDITSTRGNLKGFRDPGSPATVFMKQPDGTWKISG